MSFGYKVIAKVKFTLDRQTDGQTNRRTDRQDDSYITPKLRLRGYSYISLLPEVLKLITAFAWFITAFAWFNIYTSSVFCYYEHKKKIDNHSSVKRLP